MSEEEKSLFAFLKEYKDEPNVPDYTGEYPPPYELTQDDAELILNVKEKQDKEIERLNNIINGVREVISDDDLVVAMKMTNGEEETLLSSKELLLEILQGSDKE